MAVVGTNIECQTQMLFSLYNQVLSDSFSTRWNPRESIIVRKKHRFNGNLCLEHRIQIKQTSRV